MLFLVYVAGAAILILAVAVAFSIFRQQPTGISMRLWRGVL